MAEARVKKNSVVTVISGAHKGKSGKILDVDREKGRVVVEGVNLRKRAERRTADRPEGGITEKECPIHISNVMAQERYDARRAKRAAAK